MNTGICEYVHELMNNSGNRNNDDDHDDDDNDNRHRGIDNCDDAGNAIDNDSGNRTSIKRMKSISNETDKKE